MPTARELYADGRLESAIEALGVELRSNPADSRPRTFLFELLTFAGQYDRAEKQLDVLARGGADGELAVLPYRAALQGERVREHMFLTGDFPMNPAPSPVAGTLNGKAFTSIEDADPRVGARLEVMAGGTYMWIPFAYIEALHLEPPKMLRDLRWTPARVTTSASMRETELGEVLLPALSPLAWKLEDPELRLGRATDWEELPDGSFAPIGRKLLKVDGELISLLEVRDLVVTPAADEP
ncbi:MAG: type VI secretion system accessory protein TagJ [Gemmatimonadaceae bacterium]